MITGDNFLLMCLYATTNILQLRNTDTQAIAYSFGLHKYQWKLHCDFQRLADHLHSNISGVYSNLVV